jgi:hypothetical protein
MPRLLIAVITFGVLISACQPLSDVEPTTADGSDATTTRHDEETDSDRIVVTTGGNAIAVYRATGEKVGHVNPPAGHTYRQPTWLDDATIVFSDLSDSGDHALTAADAVSLEILWRAEMETAPFYFSPAPAGTSNGTTSLRNDPSGVGLIAELVDDEGDATLLSNESPFYTSWSPRGEDLAIHIAGQRLDVRRSGSTDTILDETGQFQAPAWVERGLLTLRTVTSIQRLTLWSEGSFTDLAELEGPAGFVASGDKVAVQARERPDSGSIAAGMQTQAVPTVPGGRLVVVDLATGMMQSVSSDLALLYQWDQAGDSLLYATLGAEPATLVWHVWSDGGNVEIASFTIQPPWFGTLVPFFDQYAQSVQFWSPSGAHVGYPAVVESSPVVVIEPLDGSDPVIIPDATWSAWAPAR